MSVNDGVLCLGKGSKYKCIDRLSGELLTCHVRVRGQGVEM